MRKLQKQIQGYVIHSGDATQGCKRCIDYTDGLTFRGHLDGTCKCLPYASDANVIDSTDVNGRLVASRAVSAITDAVFNFDASPNSACTCPTGKYTLKTPSSTPPTFACLECPTSAGFLASGLTDCNSVSQCESRGFSSVYEDVAATQPIFCACDTTKNFVDNKGTSTALEGCYCNTGDKWSTLISGEYVEATAYDPNIDYSDISNRILK